MRSYWKVRVRAQIAQYRAPDEQGKPKIVVALPRTKAGSYAVGDGRVDADEVADAIRARLSDTLTQTQRFIVLDREFGDELQAEIDHINSGNVRLQDTARVGQQLATDLILIPTIERFEYPRSVRNLRMSDRQVTSYSGGGRITLRLINATTGQVVMSDSFDHQLASTGPSTLPRVVNGRNMAAAMMESLSGQIGTSIVTTLFPVSVVSVDGDQVVLSQGGDTVQAGQRWQAVRLGEELKDPQTGRSLGRSEHPCCTIRIDRVAAQTSYGTIEDGVDAMRGGFRPGQIELRQKLGSKPAAADAGATASAAPQLPHARPPSRSPRRPPPRQKTRTGNRFKQHTDGVRALSRRERDLTPSCFPCVSTKVDTYQQPGSCRRRGGSGCGVSAAWMPRPSPQGRVCGVPATGPTPPSHRMPASAVAVASADAVALASAGAGRSPAESHYTPEGFPAGESNETSSTGPAGPVGVERTDGGHPEIRRRADLRRRQGTGLRRLRRPLPGHRRRRKDHRLPQQAVRRRRPAAGR